MPEWESAKAEAAKVQFLNLVSSAVGNKLKQHSVKSFISSSYVKGRFIRNEFKQNTQGFTLGDTNT